MHLGEAVHSLADRILIDVQSVLGLLQIGLESPDLVAQAFVFFLETHDLCAQMSQIMGLCRLGLRLANIHFFRIAAHLSLRLS